MSAGPQDEDPRAVPSLSGSLARGTAWMIGMRWTVRLIGFVSTLILARLLDPSDFGIVAMASIVVGLVDAVSGLGVDMALIQNTNASRKDFDTAWTVRLVQGLIVGSVLIASAPLAVRYFGEPRVESVIWILAISYVVVSAENIGVVAFRRDLAFARDFWLMVSKKAITFTITVGAAFWLRDYWALVVGMLAGSILGTALGYAMHPYRPRLSLAGWSKLWSFSQWMLLRNLGSFATTRSDEIIVGGLAGSRSMGFYTIASEISQLPTSELVAPIDRALFPGFALLKHDSSRLRAAYLNVLQVVAVLVIPLGLGLSATADDAVIVLLGQKWIAMVPIISILAVVGISVALRYSASSILLAIDGPKQLALQGWVQLVIFAIVAWPSWKFAGLTGIALARLFAVVVVTPWMFATLVRRTTVRWMDLFRALWRGSVSGLIMYAVVWAVPASDIGGPVGALAAEIALGALVYIAALGSLWLVSGRPDGAERLLLTQIRRLTARK